VGTLGQGLGFGEVLDAALQVFRASFWQLALTQAIVAVPVAVIQAIWLPQSLPSGPAQALDLFASRAPVTLLIGVLGILQMGAVVALAQEAAHGGSPRAGQAYRQALSRFPELLGFGLVFAVLVGVGIAIFVVPGIWVAVILSQGIFLIVLGRRGILQGITDSYRLVQGHFWRVLGIAVVAYLMVSVISLVVAMLTPSHLFGGAVMDVVTTLVSILIGSFPLVALYIQYRDLVTPSGRMAPGGD